jgi:PAS domain S-box-containing protein
MKHHGFDELINVDELQSLCEQFTRMTGFGTAFLDMEGNVLVATGWQEICSRFHRSSPASAARCRESDTVLAGRLRDGEEFCMYRCGNGLTDVAVPIAIDGKQVGRLYSGQLLLEPPDMDFFRAQAAECGFDESSYLAAVRKVPVVTEEQVRLVVGFLCRLATMIGETELANRKARDAGLMAEESPAVLFRWKATEGWPVIYVSDNVIQFGYEPEELVSGAISCSALVHPEDVQRIALEIRQYFSSGVDRFRLEHRVVTREGDIRWVSNHMAVERDADGAVTHYRGVVLDITRRRRAEEALRFTQFAVDHVFSQTFWTTEEGSILYANDAACRGLGYTREELTGMSIADILPTFSSELIAEQWQLLRHKKNLTFETLHRTKDGRIYPVEINANLVIFDGREYNCAFATDITERTSVEEELLLSHFCIDKAAIGIFQISSETGEILRVNDATCRSLGYSADELRAMSIFDIDPSLSRERFSEIKMEVDASGSVTFETVHRRRDGTTFPVEITVNILEFRGRSSGFAFVRDITERKRAIAELELTQFFVDKASEGIYRISEEGNILFANEAACRALGYTREELCSMTVFDIDPAFTLEEFREQRKSIRAVRFKTFESIHRRKDGSTFPVEVTVNYLRYQEKEVSVSFARDITERKRMEEELLKAHKLESVGLLAGGIAHDFNNLLTAILGNISLARALLSPRESAYERLRDAEQASLRAKELTHQLLTFSTGGSPVKRTISAADVVRSCARLALGNSMVTCEYLIPDDLRSIDADEGQISQVMHNLVINAVQALGGAGGITIQCDNVIIGEQDRLPLRAGCYVRISVKDRGVGIPAENLARIFDPYFTTKEQGRGLGLASSYSIVRNHGGHITVESTVGAGTTFTVYLPALDSPRAAGEHGEAPAVSGTGRVLIMDDEELIQELVGEMLGHLGYEVEGAHDGAEAIEAYLNAMKTGRPFDVVIMDLTVPGGMGGREAIRRLRELAPDVRAIVSSGYSDDPVMSNFREYGFSGVIQKPYQMHELGEEVRKLLPGNSG